MLHLLVREHQQFTFNLRHLLAQRRLQLEVDRQRCFQLLKLEIGILHFELSATTWQSATLQLSCQFSEIGNSKLASFTKSLFALRFSLS